MILLNKEAKINVSVRASADWGTFLWNIFETWRLDGKRSYYGYFNFSYEELWKKGVDLVFQDAGGRGASRLNLIVIIDDSEKRIQLPKWGQ